MTTNRTIGLFLLATTFLSSPAGAATLTPTLDTIKREAADLSGNFVLSELTSALPTGAVEVMIGDKSYYFMPSGENAALLATLAGTSAGSLIASENGIFDLNALTLRRFPTAYLSMRKERRTTITLPFRKRMRKAT